MGSGMRVLVINKEKLKRAVEGKIDLDEADFRKLMVILITIVVAAVAVNLVWGLGNYVLVQVNQSVDGSIKPLISPSVVGMSSTVYTLYIIIAIVSAVAAMIAVFIRLGKAPEATTT
jgi:hypothetical protein